MSYNSKYKGVNVENLLDKVDNMTQVTESTVSEWGFTKNTGNYDKPSDGIPKSDLASDVQTSLSKADSALQSHQDISGKQDKKSVVEVTETSASLIPQPNSIYNCTQALTSLTITSFQTTDAAYEEYMVLFQTSSTTTITLPSDVYWANGEMPNIEANAEYELSITKRIVGGNNVFRTIIVPFAKIA